MIKDCISTPIFRRIPMIKLSYSKQKPFSVLFMSECKLTMKQKINPMQVISLHSPVACDTFAVISLVKLAVKLMSEMKCPTLE